MACCTPQPLVQSSIPRLQDDCYFDYPQGQGPWYSVSAAATMAPRCSQKGPASEKECAALTLAQLLQSAAKTKGDKPALLVERPCPELKDGKFAAPPLPRDQWKTWTLKSYHDDVRKLAKAMMSFGFEQFDTANIWGFNSPEWFISSMAGMYAGGKSGGIYPTDTVDSVGFKIVHSSGVVVCVETQQHVEKVVKALNERGNCTKLKCIVSWSFAPPDGRTELDIANLGKVPHLSWETMLKQGAAGNDADLDKRVSAISPGHCAALIYTSGTTGDPKAVMVSHDNIIYVSNTVFKVLSKSCGFGANPDEERILSYLPLSHVAGMTVDLTGHVVVNANFKASSCVFFARPYDLKVGTIKDRLSIARPTAFLGVPLVWEKMADRIKAIGAATTGLKKSLADWAKAKALEHAKNIRLGENGAVPNAHCLAMRILKAVKGAVGLDLCKFACTGAAPIRVDTLEYYSSLGIYINEMYGMSESTAAATISTDQAHQWGSCGWQLPGTEVKVFKIHDSDFNRKVECPLAPALTSTEDEFQGEIAFRGRCIMMGYLACKEMGDAHVAEIEKKTSETIDADGWLHSGDKGLKTAAGMVKITGRFKEIIIGEGGENIAPVPIEDSVKGLCLGINECMMLGDKRKYNVALITLKAVGANGENPGTDALDLPAKASFPNIASISEAIKSKVVSDIITKAIQDTNSNGKLVPNNAFKIQKYTILPTNFSEEMGELTPTKKLKRGIVEKSYQQLIDHMYANDGTYIEYKAF